MKWKLISISLLLPTCVFAQVTSPPLPEGYYVAHCTSAGVCEAIGPTNGDPSLTVTEVNDPPESIKTSSAALPAPEIEGNGAINGLGLAIGIALCVAGKKRRNA